MTEFMKKPAGLPDDVWDGIIHPSTAHYCRDCRHCKPIPQELRRKGRASSYCDADIPVYKTTGIQINGLWYESISAKQWINCKLFEPVKGDRS